MAQIKQIVFDSCQKMSPLASSGGKASSNPPVISPTSGIIFTLHTTFNDARLHDPRVGLKTLALLVLALLKYGCKVLPASLLTYIQ